MVLTSEWICCFVSLLEVSIFRNTRTLRESAFIGTTWHEGVSIHRNNMTWRGRYSSEQHDMKESIFIGTTLHEKVGIHRNNRTLKESVFIGTTWHEGVGIHRNNMTWRSQYSSEQHDMKESAFIGTTWHEGVGIHRNNMTWRSRYSSEQQKIEAVGIHQNKRTPKEPLFMRITARHQPNKPRPELHVAPFTTWYEVTALVA